VGRVGEGAGGWVVMRTSCLLVLITNHMNVAESAVLGADGRILVVIRREERGEGCGCFRERVES